MRFVDHEQLMRFADLEPLREANLRLKAAVENERTNVMNEEEAKCSALRTPLWAVGSAKCWYSEVTLQEGEGHVEHYRPKRRLWGADHDGYWWRALDWRNLRLAHPTTNKRMTDFITKEKAGKGSYFPLRDGTPRATCEVEEDQEEPVLLDPTKLADTLLLAFAFDSGAAVPRYDPDTNPWLSRRASDSIGYYHLNDGTWTKDRHDLMHIVDALCSQIEDVVAHEPRDDAEYDRLINDLANYIGPFARFSSACLQVVRERGLLEHIAGGVI